MTTGAAVALRRGARRPVRARAGTAGVRPTLRGPRSAPPSCLSFVVRLQHPFRRHLPPRAQQARIATDRDRSGGSRGIGVGAELV